MREKILAGRYVLVEQIGVGGMAIVYRAIDRNTGHPVAVKVLKPEFNRDAEFVSRFQREAEAASKMIHHNIVNLLDVGMDGDNRFLIMEHVKGQTLKEVILEHGRLGAPTAAQIAIRILSALQHAHKNGIIHRDIKPQNILMNAEGHVKVADFGIARMANTSTLTRGDSVMGSVHYFSPEQAQGQGCDVTSDIYSVGVTLYEMLTGRVPFDGDSPVAIAMQHLHAQPEDIHHFAPDVPDAICHVCLKAMEKNPAYRYASAREMAAELRKALNGEVNQLMPRVTPVQPQRQLTASIQPTPQQPRVRQTTGRNHRTRQNNPLGMVVTTLVVLVVVFYGLFIGTRAIYDKVVNSATVGFYENSERSAAVREVNRIGLEAQIVEVNHSTIPAGVVITQWPKADTTLRKGDKVVLTVSIGPESMTVPIIRNMTLADATTTLKAYGLTLTVVERVVDLKHDVDLVLTQVPAAGAPCQPGDSIQVTVSGGIAYVPRVQGRTFSEARELIASAGLTFSGSVEYVETNDPTLHGKVKQQSIPADTAVILGTSVSLSVYRMPAMLHRARITLELPESNGLTSVRVTINDDGGEVVVFQGDYPSNASRHPEAELISDEAGEYSCKVYVNNVFKYSVTVKFE